MEAAIALESRQLALALHRLLQDLDAARFREDMQEALAERLKSIQASIDELLERIDHSETATTLRRFAASDGIEALRQRVPDAASVRHRLDEMQAVIASALPTLEDAEERARVRWMELRARMQPVYEGLVVGLKAQDIHVPRLRPTNYKRNFFHMSSWLAALGVITVSGAGTAMVAIAWGMTIFAWTAETTRRRWPAVNDLLMKAFGSVAHPHEWKRVNSATWYATALAMLSLTHSSLVAYVAVTALGLGDPIAALVGRRWGKHRIVNGRSIEGSLAFTAASTLGLMGVFAVLGPAMPFGAALLLAVASSATGAVAEMLCRKIDDNFAIPLVSGATAALLALALGLPL